MIVASTIRVGAGDWPDASRRRKRPSLSGPCCRPSSNRAASGSTVAVGTVEPRYKTNLGFRVLGRLIARPVNVGDLVARRADRRRDRSHGA